MPITPPFYPIIYIRGYAATMAEIEDTVATPYMGFELGTTKLRQNWEGKPVRHIFESPLLRLMKDYGYTDSYRNGDLIPESAPAPSRSIWIFRYYEQASESLGTGKRQDIPAIARELRKFVLRVRRQVCMNDDGTQDSNAVNHFKVHLVAHSMGGLIARCYLQNICATTIPDEALELPGDHYVDKVFTYATPHNGIDFLGINMQNLPWDPFDTANFNRDTIRKYLCLPDADERVDSLNDAFPAKQFFCLVGTNYKDYGAFYGVSKRVTGEMSDGLVMMANAFVKDAPRAFVHRSHSGHYGIVNSEEGYQNLRRFLFGQVAVKARLVADAITLPAEIQSMKDNNKVVRASYYVEATAQTRGARYFLTERKVDQASALLQRYDHWVGCPRGAYLFTGYLDKKGKDPDSTDTALGFSVRVAVKHPEYEVDKRFWPDAYYEGADIIVETITFRVEYTEEGADMHYGLASKHGSGTAPIHIVPDEPTAGHWVYSIPLGFGIDDHSAPKPGFSGKLILDVVNWS